MRPDLSTPQRSTARRLAIAVGAVLCIAAAADPAERLADPGQEGRARALFRETRCLVCQGESIDDSDADLAGDLRRVIRRQVAAGRTDAQVRTFLVDRYGEFVLFRPRLSLANSALWGAPFVVAFLGIGWLALRRSAPPPTSPLTEAEEKRIHLVDTGEDGEHLTARKRL